MHGMNGRFNAILLARAELETARCLLDVLVGQTEDGLELEEKNSGPARGPVPGQEEI